MDKLILENVRCFATRQEVPLAPLTLLVGENSTGKTTFLAMIRAAWDLVAGNGMPDFNEPPFDLGAFEQIVTKQRRGKNQNEFVIGAEVLLSTSQADKPSERIELLVSFADRNSNPNLLHWNMKWGEFTLDAASDNFTRFVAKFEANGKSARPEVGSAHPLLALAEMPLLIRLGKWTPDGQLSSRELIKLLEAGTSQLFRLQSMLPARPLANAPVRTKPERMYHPRTDEYRPEGNHVPMVLSQLSMDESRWGPLSEPLAEFGRAAGLFDSLSVKRMGRKASDPFQLHVKRTGPSFNLVDVGYGVSQVLPMLIDTALAERGQTFLIQQPEVHLHPRAQAELATFFGKSAVKQKKRFVVETHSDYMLDRVRLDVRDGKYGLKPTDVVILYFQRDKTGVNIHPIRIDKQGNLVDVPEGYRKFFLDEERRFLRLND